MAKYQNDALNDAALNEIKTNANLLTVCSTQPTTRDEAITTYKLADIAVDTDDFTLADDAGGGRKLTVGAQNDVDVDTGGTAAHVAIVDGTRLLAVTTCAGQAVSAGGKVNIAAFKIVVGDAS